MTHPVDELEQREFTYAAGVMAASVKALGYGWVNLCPDDGTTYKLAVIRPMVITVDGIIPNQEAGLWFASSFGAMYPVNLTAGYHWDYVNSHFLDKPHEWTARVLARFLTALSEAMKET